jgi:hypothetical protein
VVVVLPLLVLLFARSIFEGRHRSCIDYLCAEQILNSIELSSLVIPPVTRRRRSSSSSRFKSVLTIPREGIGRGRQLAGQIEGEK